MNPDACSTLIRIFGLASFFWGGVLLVALFGKEKPYVDGKKYHYIIAMAILLIGGVIMLLKG